MVQYKLKQRGFYYFKSIPALLFCVSEKPCWCEKRDAFSTLPLRLIDEKGIKKGSKHENFLRSIASCKTTFGYIWHQKAGLYIKTSVAVTFLIEISGWACYWSS